MKKSKTNGIETLIEEAKLVLTLSFGVEYILHDIHENGEIRGFIARDFSFHYWNEEEQPGLFYISFMVGTKCKKASDVTRLICTVINYEYIYALDDFYWDYDQNKMLFGEDAIRKKYEDLLDADGKAKCPICDMIHKKKRFTEKGVCEVCDRVVIDNLVWH